nr:hypothetical protein GCM10020185_52690 [Pseudomonas brassicacearum subsp. brassicacearum]
MRMPKNIARPIAMTGNMVSSEAVLKLKGTSPRIADNNGPTAAIEGRRFSATKTMLTISQMAWVLEVRIFFHGAAFAGQRGI